MTLSIEELKEKAKNVKIIFFDIDDTLRLKDQQFMPESVKEVFARLKEKNIPTGIATGRALPGVVEEVKNLHPDYYVSINGQYVISNDEEEIYSNHFPQEPMVQMIESLKEQNSEYIFVGSHSLAASNWNKTAEDAMTVVYGKIDEDVNFHENHRVYQMLTISPDADSLFIPEELKKNFRLVKWHKSSNDIIPLAGSKANGIQKVLDKLNLTPEEVLVFGDELNDVEMFKFAGIAIAMGNAHEHLKELADFVTKPVEEDGILFALETLGVI